MARKKALTLVFLVCVAIYAFIFTFLAFYYLFKGSPTLLLMLYFVLFIATLLYAAFRIGTLRREVVRITEGAGYPVVSQRSIKKIKILNPEGDALVDYILVCKNMSDRKLRRLHFSYPFDGILENIEVTVNGNKAKAAAEVFTAVRRTDGLFKPVSQLPNTAKIFFDFEEMDIKPDEIFECKMALTIKECYHNLFKLESSTFEASIPTKEFLLALMLSDDLLLQPDSVEFQVQTSYEIDDAAESAHIKEHCPPRIFNSYKAVVWKIPDPKLTARYKLSFALREDR